MNYSASFIAIGFFYELLFQYPNFLPHPISLYGKAITCLEKLFLVKGGKIINIITGTIMVLCLAIATYFVFYFIEKNITNVWILFVVRIFFVISCVAAGSLFFECLKVLKYIEINRLDLAKTQLSMLVTRDTSDMSESKILETTLETLSENLCDGVISPIFYLFLGGVPVAMTYKMCSTLDSMIGYKSERYQYFGKFAARLDDVLNFIPARLTALCIIFASYLMNFNAKGALKSWLIDSKKSESPNSGNPEAAMAGALGIKFGGTVSYFGKQYQKPQIGPGISAVKREDIKSGIKLSYVASLMFLVAAFVVEYLVKRFV